MEELSSALNCHLMKISNKPNHHLEDGGGDQEQPQDEESAEQLILHEDSPPPADLGLDYLIHPLSRDLVLHCVLLLPRSNYGVLASLNRSFRSLLRSGELYKLRRQASVSENWIYVSTSPMEWEAFDVNQRRWMRLPRMPPASFSNLRDKEAVAVGTHLLIWGRDFTSLTVTKYSILTNSWSPGVPMNTPRSLSGFASLGQIAISAGGIDADGRVLNSAEMYDSESETWVTLPSFEKPRYKCLGFFLDGKFYIMGGLGSKKEAYTCAEEYDLERGSWRIVPDMHPAWCSPTGPPISVAVVKNELYMADHASKEVRKFGRENRRWVQVGRLPEKVAPSNGWGFGFRGCRERMIVVGGERGVKGGSLEVYTWEIIDGLQQVWELVASRPSGKFLYNCAVMGC